MPQLPSSSKVRRATREGGQHPSCQIHKHLALFALFRRRYSVWLTHEAPKPVTRPSAVRPGQWNYEKRERETNDRRTARPKIFDPISSLNLGGATRLQQGFEQIVLGCSGDRETSCEHSI